MAQRHRLMAIIDCEYCGKGGIKVKEPRTAIIRSHQGSRALTVCDDCFGKVEADNKPFEIREQLNEERERNERIVEQLEQSDARIAELDAQLRELSPKKATNVAALAKNKGNAFVDGTKKAGKRVPLPEPEEEEEEEEYEEPEEEEDYEDEEIYEDESEADTDSEMKDAFMMLAQSVQLMAQNQTEILKELKAQKIARKPLAHKARRIRP